MIKELNTLVMDNKDKRVDEDFIYDAYDIIRANNPKLKSFLSQIHVENECERDPFTGGEYYNTTGDIVFYLNPLDKFDVSEEFRHYLALRTIDHEIEHARILMNFLEHKNDIESLVSSYTVSKYEYETYSGLPEFRHNCYMYDPQERIANIKSTKFVVNLLKNRRDSESLILARCLLLNAYKRGYQSNGYYLESPTYKYLIKNDMSLELDDLMDKVRKSNYSLDTRVLCGLPITYEEEKSLSDKARVRDI